MSICHVLHSLFKALEVLIEQTLPLGLHDLATVSAVVLKEKKNSWPDVNACVSPLITDWCWPRFPHFLIYQRGEVDQCHSFRWCGVCCYFALRYSNHHVETGQYGKSCGCCFLRECREQSFSFSQIFQSVKKMSGLWYYVSAVTKLSTGAVSNQSGPECHPQ